MSVHSGKLFTSPITNPHQTILRRTHNTTLRCRTVTYQHRRQSLAAIQSNASRLPPTPCKTNYASRKRTKKLHHAKEPRTITPSPKKRRTALFGKTNKSDERWRTSGYSSQVQCFKNLGLIGVGSFSQVFKVQNENTTQIYALKQSSTFLNTREAVSEALNEVEIIKLLQNDVQTIKDYASNISEIIDEKDEEETEGTGENKHIIKFRDFWISYDRRLHQLYDYYEYGTLLDIVEYNSRLNYLQILEIIQQICNGLQLVHSNNILHIDLKPENIYISGNYILKIGDFGISVNLNNKTNCTPRSKSKHSKYQYSGDPIYIAPELMNFDRTLTNDINTATDIFSLGIILLELLCDIKAPSQGQIFHNLRKNIVNFDVIEPSPIKKTTQIIGDIDKEIKNLCRNMLHSASHLRPNCTQILEKINDILNNREYIKYFSLCKPFNGLCLPPQTIIDADAESSINHNINHGINCFYTASPICYDSLFGSNKNAVFSPIPSNNNNDPFRLNLNSAFESASKYTISPSPSAVKLKDKKTNELCDVKPKNLLSALF